MPAKRSYPNQPRPSATDIIEQHRSMLGDNSLPKEYGLIESATEAWEAAFPTDERVVRLTIIWDNQVRNLDLERTLDAMRETGAAFVFKVEALP